MPVLFSIVFLVLFASLTWSQGKPEGKYIVGRLTNADVIRMIKADFDESVLINVIKTSDNQFDLSVDGLFKLSKAGVNQRIIRVMQESNRTVTPPVPKTSEPTASEADIALEMPLMGILWLDGDTKVVMRQAVMAVGQRSGRGIIPIIGGKLKATLKGKTAELSLANSKPEFLVGQASPIDPAYNISLVRLEVKEDRREVTVIRVNVLGSSSGPKGDSMVAITIDEERMKSRGGLSDNFRQYRIRPLAPLSPGEYAIITQRGSLSSGFYDFAVEK